MLFRPRGAAGHMNDAIHVKYVVYPVKLLALIPDQPTPYNRTMISMMAS